MLNRIIGLLYILAAAWLAIVWYFFARIEPSPGAQFFMVMVVGAPPLALLMLASFVFPKR